MLRAVQVQRHLSLGSATISRKYRLLKYSAMLGTYSRYIQNAKLLSVYHALPSRILASDAPNSKEE